MTDSITNATELATGLTIAWLGNANTRVRIDDVPAFLRRMHDALTSLAAPAEAAPEEEATSEPQFTPAVSVRKSLASKDHIVSLIDGKPYKTLRRHLSAQGLTPDQYRQRYGLKPDYPMVAESYSQSRRDMAQRIGVGRKPGQKASRKADAEEPIAAPIKRRRILGIAAARAHLGTGGDEAAG